MTAAPRPSIVSAPSRAVQARRLDSGAVDVAGIDSVQPSWGNRGERAWGRLLFAVSLVILPLEALGAWSIERTPERVARGEYLVKAVVGCRGCHSERDLGKCSYPPKAGRELAGGIVFRNIGPHAVSPNITPYALADWTDQQIVDAVTRGISKDGRHLHRVMPASVYAMMDQADLYAIIAYLRTIPGIAADPYPHEFGNVGSAASEFPETKLPRKTTTDVQRGAYLVGIAGCNGCHHGDGETPDSGPAFIGGKEFKLPGRGFIRSANLTSDVATGLGAYTREAFIARVKGMRGSEKVAIEYGKPNTVMHRWAYANMTDADLGAIYSYLHTLAPVSNRVIRFEPLPGKVASPNWSEINSGNAAAR